MKNQRSGRCERSQRWTSALRGSTCEASTQRRRVARSHRNAGAGHRSEARPEPNRGRRGHRPVQHALPRHTAHASTSTASSGVRQQRPRNGESSSVRCDSDTRKKWHAKRVGPSARETSSPRTTRKSRYTGVDEVRMAFERCDSGRADKENPGEIVARRSGRPPENSSRRSGRAQRRQR